MTGSPEVAPRWSERGVRHPAVKAAIGFVLSVALMGAYELWRWSTLTRTVTLAAAIIVVGGIILVVTARHRRAGRS